MQLNNTTIIPTKSVHEAYKNFENFVEDIRVVFENDYGRYLSNDEAIEVAKNFDLILHQVL